MRRVRLQVLSVATLLLCVGWAIPHANAQPAARAVAALSAAGLPAQARAMPLGGSLRVDGVALDGLGDSSLELERFAVFSSDAVIHVRGRRNRDVAAPDNGYFRGHVVGVDGSVAVLTALASGGLRGVVTAGGSAWVIDGHSSQAQRSRPSARRIDLDRELGGRSFACGTDRLPAAALEPGGGGGEAPAVGGSTAPAYTARIAVDTDYEFYAMFGNVTAATDYAGDLIAYSSTIYQTETTTSLHVSDLTLWTGGAASDPYSSSTTDGALSELRGYWNANKGGVERTVVHLLSGKSSGGGIAYVGVLCNSSYGYGVSGSLSGNFDIDNPQVVWDALVVAHELGHNFNSPHTHCYNGIGGADAVDQCYGSEGGCYNGPTALPGGCGGAGQGCGTIMSYCHLLSGGYGNITMTLGTGHAQGIDPDRVPSRMYDHVVNRAAAFPGCLDAISTDPVLTVSKAGNGDGDVTSAPAGISCGADCSEAYLDGTVVTLTATPSDALTSFDGWTGDADCADGSVTMTGDVACTATFSTDCGDGVCDGAETCANCADDCTGSVGGASCGNGVCEAGDGEDCVTCAADCAGKQNGKPSRRWCCGNGGQGPVDCGDNRCGDCTDLPAGPGGATCCGDLTCEGDESSFVCERDCGPAPVCGDGSCDDGLEDTCTCALDCGAPPADEGGACSDGVDNDCDGASDCDDAECAADAACSCQPKGASCVDAAECCSGSCKGRTGRKSCK